MCSIDVGFNKADSGNLPEVDIFMIMDYFNKNKEYISTEMKGIKLQRSGRQKYGDNAIGYVQLRQQQSVCELKAKITPEHKIKAKNYNVQCIINTSERVIIEAKCNDCAASEGGCKHAVAFLMWLHRRSEEPSPTEKQCYWKRSLLSTASSTNTFISTSDFNKNKITTSYDDSLLLEYVEESKKRKLQNSLMRHQMEEQLIKEVEKVMRKQSESKLWQEMRYARITASKVYEVVKCKTQNGSLVETILGAKLFQTEAMSRGLKLENSILKVLSQDMSQEFFKSGIFLSKDFPLLGASPDAINDDFVVEIKSPTSQKTFTNYLDSNVADPQFEATKKIYVKHCDYDSELVKNITNKVNEFWFNAIYHRVKF
ncbi:hypothetical protein NQ315_006054 [Exocentrus adspersus]|uniref:YqaJ viral recombinase domain-containing protein n=1 Tax=Exocentrus adspersus TaxID=1586481 RepID=A0AAV8VGY9_9CUCU|nr:hypothetical protein NQ315_006054 [Exocentrus adspersus]